VEMPGGIGIGLVWGWLIGGRRWSPLSVGAWLLTAMVVAAEATLLAGPRVAVPLLGAVVVAATLHAAWRHELGLRRDANASSVGTGPDPGGGGEQ
jgi:hypothetical protein